MSNFHANTNRVRPVNRATFGLILVFSIVLFNLASCDSVNISGTPTTTPVDSSGTATLSISNRIAIDPGTLTFYLFPGISVDFTNAANATKLGDVDVGATVAFTVKTGAWKLAYANKAQVLVPMRDEASGGQEWLQSTFKKDGIYTVILGTDGNRDIWTTNYTTNPPMSP